MCDGWNVSILCEKLYADRACSQVILGHNLIILLMLQGW